MSYRTYINGKQIFGNNEGYKEWFDFILTQGIEIDAEGNYEGTIKDFMGALETIEKITLRLTKERSELNKMHKNSPRTYREIFDFTNIPNKLETQEKDDKFRISLFDELFDVVNNGYAFMPYQFFLACEDLLEPEKMFSTEGHMNCYKIKAGETIHVKAN